jgi:hypothetical protein
MTAALTALVRAIGNDERMLREVKDDLLLRIMAGVQHHLHRSGLHDVGLICESFVAPIASSPVRCILSNNFGDEVSDIMFFKRRGSRPRVL